VTRPLILLVTTLCFLTQSLPVQGYDVGSGSVFNEEGAGYEHSYCTPSFLHISIGVLGSLAIVAGIIAVGNSSSSGSLVVDPTEPETPTEPEPVPQSITLPVSQAARLPAILPMTNFSSHVAP
jgi:hypothetical protein